LKLTWPVTAEHVGFDIDAFLNVAERHHRASSRSGAVPDVLERMFECCSERSWTTFSKLVDDYDFVGKPLLAEMGDLSGVAKGAEPDEASLYFRSPEQAFSADRVISQSHIWDAWQATFRFDLPGGSNVTHVRFDPSNAPGAFQVSEIRINGTTVSDLKGRSRSVNRHMLLDQLNGGGVGFLSFDCDPQVEFDLQDELSGCDGRVTIELDCRKLETDNAVDSLLSDMLSGLRADVGRQSESLEAAIGRLEAGVVSDLGREVRLQREVDELKAENAQIKARHDALEEREARLRDDVELLRAREARLFDSGAWMAGLVARLRDESAVDHRRQARLERDNDELQRQQELLGAQLTDALHARDLARCDLDEIRSSTLWRLLTRIRRLLEYLSPGTRRLLRRLMKGAWWIVTPWRMPARIAYIRRRRNAGRESR
jgi:FtsZ-binding cell division protein ZapB